jgi:hypothetical protein
LWLFYKTINSFLKKPLVSGKEGGERRKGKEEGGRRKEGGK